MAIKLLAFHFALKDADPNELTTKEHCWRLDKLGAVGESLLHVCMLMGSPVHIELAKRLLHFFPRLINDIYVSEDYYGKLISRLDSLFVFIKTFI